MKALVTGACGFVGSYLLKHLLERGDQVLGTHLGDITLPVSGVQYTSLDITSAEQCLKVINEFKPDAVYHLAGISFVPEAEKNFDLTMNVHVTGVHNVLEALGSLGNKARFLLTSSAEVYGKIDPAAMPLRETTEPNPVNTYSLSKLCGELVARKYHATGSVHTIIARPFNHTGAGQNNRFVASDFAFQIAEIAKGNRSPDINVGNLAVHRDFSDVRDIVRGYRLAVERGTGIYNFSSGRPVAVKDVLQKLISISGLDIKVHRDPNKVRVADRPLFYGDSSKAKQELDWSCKYSLDETLKDVYEYWLNRA